MKTPLPMLLAGALGLSSGWLLCRFVPEIVGRGATVETSGAFAGLLDMSAYALELGDAEKATGILSAAMAHPSATWEQFSGAVGLALQRVSATGPDAAEKIGLLDAAEAGVSARMRVAGTGREAKDLAAMLDRIGEVREVLVADAEAALLRRIGEHSTAPAGGGLAALTVSPEWRDYVALAKSGGRDASDDPEEVVEAIGGILRGMAEGLPERGDLDELACEEPADTGTGPIEERKAALNRTLLGISGPGVSAIAGITADPSLKENVENLAVALVAAIGRCDEAQKRAYNLWALGRIHAAETVPSWEGALAPVNPAFLQNVVGSLYADVSARRMREETDPGHRAAKVRIMVREKKITPAAF
ncbi:MAG: hypothetical protein J0M04_18660 [Verrucomicrobia bacterium]|nr:hypothetical protein [Verrucomicrobiota bacterium]